MLKIAHRGAKGCEDENTLAAFEKALELGADGIELDVHLSVDGHVIVIHDHSADRTSDGAGNISEMLLKDIKKVRTKGGHEIPTLAETLDFIDNRCLVNIELKTESAVVPVAAIIQKLIFENEWNYDNFLVSSFEWTALKHLRTINKKIPLGVLASTNLNLAISFAKTISAETIHPYFHLLDAENTKLMQQQGFKVFAWTVNDNSDIAKVKSFTVDGIISDYPERL